MTHVPPALYSVDLGGCTELVGRAPDEIMATFCAALRRAGATVVQERLPLRFRRPASRAS